MNFVERYPNKYGAKRTLLDGRSFASGLEAATYLYLKGLEKLGEVKDIQCQKTVTLTPSVRFRCDFSVFDIKLNQTVYVEAKGFEGERWRVIRQLWKDCGPGILRVYKGSKHRVYMAEEIKGKT